MVLKRITQITLVNIFFLTNCMAADLQPNANLDYNSTIQQIKKDSSCIINYNSAKSSAIVTSCDSLNLDIYINYKNRTARSIYAARSDIKWFGDDVATLTGSCGSGCAKTKIFIAPTTVIQCPMHEFRFENLSADSAPDYSNNTPFLIDPKKKIYVCYDEADNLQVYSFPQHAAIAPPTGSHVVDVKMVNAKLVVTYQKGEKDKITKTY